MNEHAFMIAGAVNDHSEAADQLVEVARVASRDSERIRLAGHRVATAAQGARLAAEEADAYTEQLGSLASQLSGLTLRFTR
jgi:methyl-accepting chemotaxis protein